MGLMEDGMGLCGGPAAAGVPHLDGLDGVFHLKQAALGTERVDTTIILAASEKHHETPTSRAPARWKLQAGQQLRTRREAAWEPALTVSNRVRLDAEMLGAFAETVFAQATERCIWTTA